MNKNLPNDAYPSLRGKRDGVKWTDRRFTFGLPAGMLPYYLERLEGTIFRMVAKVEDIPEELLSYRLDGKWSIRRTLATWRKWMRSR